MPWGTRGIRQSMEIRDTLYKQCIKSENNPTCKIKQAVLKSTETK